MMQGHPPISKQLRASAKPDRNWNKCNDPRADRNEGRFARLEKYDLTVRMGVASAAVVASLASLKFFA